MIATIAKDVLQGLQYLHNHDSMHRFVCHSFVPVGRVQDDRLLSIQSYPSLSWLLGCCYISAGASRMLHLSP